MHMQYIAPVLSVYLFGEYTLVGNVTLLIKPHVKWVFSASSPMLENACPMFLYSVPVTVWG